MYWDGKGGPQDRERAKYIWMWAAENKDPLAVVKLEELGYDMKKERELAFDKAKVYKSQPADVRSESDKAAEGLAIVFGFWLLSVLSQDRCQQYRQAQLMGLVAFIPSDCL